MDLNFLPQLITFSEKAPNFCGSCRVRKEKCDRRLPQCERCATKGCHCDYTRCKESLLPGSSELEVLVIHHEVCDHEDLSSHGTNELFRLIRVCIDDASPLDSFANFLKMVRVILDEAGFDLSIALEQFGPSVQQWCPIVSEDLLRGCENDISRQIKNMEGPKSPFLWLCLWLVMDRPCAQHKETDTRELYRTMKQIAALLQSRPGLGLDVFQIGMMIAIYEAGHGLTRQAFQTLVSTSATLKMLELETKQLQDRATLEMVQWLKSSLLMLDRFVSLTTPTQIIPLNIPSDDPISTSVAESLAPIVPLGPPISYSSSPHKVHIRSVASLASGHVMEYIYARDHGLEPNETYEQVSEVMDTCIKALTNNPQPHTWLHCDSIAMASCSNILLHYSHMRHLYATTRAYTLEGPSAEYLQVQNALAHWRHVAWDMVRFAIEVIQDEKEVALLPLAGLCCVLRAGLAVLETREYVDEDMIQTGEIDGYIVILRWFANRWMIGEEYLKRVELLL